MICAVREEKHLADGYEWALSSSKDGLSVAESGFEAMG